VPSSADVLHPGEFAFIKKRESIRTFERVLLEPPHGFRVCGGGQAPLRRQRSEPGITSLANQSETSSSANP
jgi:hypothetical protein